MAIDGDIESTLPKDYVAWQRYPSGELLSYGTTITVRLSSGPKKVLVPSVSGDSVFAAETKLKNVNLLIDVQEEESDTVEIEKNKTYSLKQFNLIDSQCLKLVKRDYGHDRNKVVFAPQPFGIYVAIPSFIDEKGKDINFLNYEKIASSDFIRVHDVALMSLKLCESKNNNSNTTGSDNQGVDVELIAIDMLSGKPVMLKMS